MRVIVADDSPWLLEMLPQALQDGGAEIVAVASSADELLAQARAHRPDAVLVDINFGGLRSSYNEDGLRAAAALRADYPEMGIVICSVHMSAAYMRRITGIGAGTHIGYLCKDRVDTRTVLDALARVIAGDIVVDQALAADMLRTRRVKDPISRLTDRQRQVLELLAEGRSNKAIAGKLRLAPATVEAYLTEVFKTLQIPNSPDHHKRVLAVLAWLGSPGASRPPGGEAAAERR
jgi:DNA-binding NarL/FixJ family response regulator